MRQICLFSGTAVLVMGWGLALQPAFAQSSLPGSSDMRSPSLQPQSLPAENLPPALPGFGNQAPSAVPGVSKPQTGDPTAQLFTAINANDYNSAQDALSRGADLDAQNALGETPIDLSVALNRNSITFMLLSARNVAGGDDSDAQITGTPASSPAASAAQTPAVPIKLIQSPNQPSVPGNNPGVPNPSAGFLGFSN